MDGPGTVAENRSTILSGTRFGMPDAFNPLLKCIEFRH
jgi:hypothetical protein